MEVLYIFVLINPSLQNQNRILLEMHNTVKVFINFHTLIDKRFHKCNKPQNKSNNLV